MGMLIATQYKQIFSEVSGNFLLPNSQAPFLMLDPGTMYPLYPPLMGPAPNILLAESVGVKLLFFLPTKVGYTITLF